MISLIDTIAADLPTMLAGWRGWTGRSRRLRLVDQAIDQITAWSVTSGFADITLGLARARERSGRPGLGWHRRTGAG
ncbi:hypothetical protein ACWDUH_00635 [Micromonospora wenchangensis]